jgi:epoxyqueuosine reductase
VDAPALIRVSAELGLDAVGATPAEPYGRAERAIRERGQRGLFASMGFTMARPELSCHPERLLESARSVISAALSYYAPGPDPGAGEGRLARHAWRDLYAELRLKLDRLGRRLGGSYRVLVDSSEHVDREAAALSGVGFYGKNALLIVPRLGSWVVLGTLISDVRVEPTAPLARDCGRCTLCLEACPTGALVEPGVLDARRCLAYWTQAPAAIPKAYRELLGSRVYGCDICQEVCPWNRSIEKRRAGTEPSPGSEPVVSLESWLTLESDALRRRYQRLYVPRNDVRYLRRNALVALASGAGADGEALLERYAAGEDELLSEHASWALERLQAA